MDRMNPWRLITHDGVTASAGLAADETLTALVGEGASRPVLRLYTYRECALVGRFQNIYNELRLENCAAGKLPVNRRPTGGGAIVMGPDQLGVAWIVQGAAEDSYVKAREMMAHFAGGLLRGLEGMGVRAAFRGKNDLEVDGRKIAGLGIFRHSGGGVLYHASLLVDLDVEFMLEILNTPFEKITDKEIRTVAARTSTVRKEAGAGITLDEVRRQVAEGFAAAFGAELEPDRFTGAEEARIAQLEAAKYCTDDWVYQAPEVADAFGSAKVKTPAGLLDVRVTVAGSMVKAAFITGDFFAGEAAVAALEAGLRWHRADHAAIRETLARIHGERYGELAGLPLASLVEAVGASVDQARAAEAGGNPAAYGCFANPQG